MADLELHIDDYISVDYLKKQLGTDNVSINSTKSFNEYEIQKQEYIFDPQETGTYKIEYDGNILTVEVNNISDKIIDNFELKNSNPGGPYESGDSITKYYRGYTSGFSRTASSPIEGDYSLQTSAGNGFAIFSEPGDGLPSYPDSNDTINVLLYNTGNLPVIFFSTTYDSGNDNINGYSFRLWEDNNEINLKKYNNSSASDINTNRTELDVSSTSISTNNTYWIEISTPDTNGNMSGTLYEADSNLNRGSQLASVSATDTTHSHRGIGFGSSLGGTGIMADRLQLS